MCPSLVKEHPPLTFYPNFLHRSKFTQMSTHPWPSCGWRLRSTASSAIHIWGKKLCVILHQRLLQGIFVQTDVANAVYTMSYTMLMVTWYHSECCVVRTRLQVAGGSVLCTHNYLSTYTITCFKGIESLETWHGCSFMVKCRNIQKSTHLLFGRLVRSSTTCALSPDYGS